MVCKSTLQGILLKFIDTRGGLGYLHCTSGGKRKRKKSDQKKGHSTAACTFPGVGLAGIDVSTYLYIMDR